MTAVISTTYDHKYLYFLPITVWLWHQLEVDTICFMPYLNTSEENKAIDLINDTFREIGIKPQYAGYASPEHKTATYAQCLRNYAACLDLPDDEFIVTSDVDMALFQIPDYCISDTRFSVFGSDLVPEGQYPQCYITGKVKLWRDAFNLHGITYQQAIDRLLGEDECQDYRGCRWSVDQEQSFLNISKTVPYLIKRAREGTQFASKRYDRDDSFILDRLNPDTIDYHMNRPGYEPANFDIILQILSYHYPAEDFTWLINYTNEYKKLL